MPKPVLRPWQTSDASPLATLLGNPHVHRFLSPTLPRPYGLQEAEEFIRFCHQNSALERAILAGHTLVGGIGARLSKETADLGYWLGEPYWRQGIMSQAIPLFLAELQTLAPQVRHITAQVYDFNNASRSLLLACGFQQTDTFRLLPACDGREHPVFCYIFKAKR